MQPSEAVWNSIRPYGASSSQKICVLRTCITLMHDMSYTASHALHAFHTRSTRVPQTLQAADEIYAMIRKDTFQRFKLSDQAEELLWSARHPPVTYRYIPLHTVTYRYIPTLLWSERHAPTSHAHAYLPIPMPPPPPFVPAAGDVTSALHVTSSLHPMSRALQICQCWPLATPGKLSLIERRRSS